MRIPDPDLRALATGESIVAFVPGDEAPEPGSEVALEPDGPRLAARLKPAYRAWADAGPPPGRWSGQVVAVWKARDLDPEAAARRHVLEGFPAPWVVVLQVTGPDGPVLSPSAFAARLRSLEAARR